MQHTRSRTIHASGLFLLTSVLLLGGCGPVYDTVYDFTPPTTSFGAECVENCKDSQSECEDFERERNDDCEERQKAQMDRCNDRILADKKRAPKWTECGKTESCTEDTAKCESRYRTCYQACGGTISSKQVCVAFCE